MAFLIDHAFHEFITDVTWSNRAGIASFRIPCTLKRCINLHVVGVHGPHEDRQVFTEDVAKLLAKTAVNDKIIAAGDWNYDLLGVATDPAGVRVTGDNSGDFNQLLALLQAHGLEFKAPTPSETSPGGAFGLRALQEPISRIPTGLRELTDSPTLLDYAFASPNLVDRAWLQWHGSLTDHAISYAALVFEPPCAAFKASTWNCADEERAAQWLLANPVESLATVSTFICYVTEFMAANRDATSRSTRRARPLSPELHTLYQRIAFTSGFAERGHLVSQARLLRNRWVDCNLQAQFDERIAKGAAINRVTKLKTINALVLTAASGSEQGSTSRNRADWSQEIATEYNRRWKSTDMQRRSLLKDVVASFGREHCRVTRDDVARAISNVKPSKRLDQDGLCMKALYLVFLRAPAAIVDVLNQLLESPDELKERTISGTIKGKISSITSVCDTRSLLPLPSLLVLIDYILARRVTMIVEQVFGNTVGAYIGAKRGTQVTEAVGGIVLAIEKGLDSQGRVALADYDIQNFYDTIDPILLARWWVSQRLPVALIASVLRTLLLPAVTLKATGVSVKLLQRTCGLYTGSRLAAALGQIPVRDVVSHAYADLLIYGFNTPSVVLMLTTWVDNITAIGPSSFAATSALDLLERELADRWRLTIKPSSRQYAAARPTDRVLDEKWSYKNLPILLGHLVSMNGCPRLAWKVTRGQAWQLFYKKVYDERTKKLPLSRCAVLVDRFILPFLRFRWAIWPFTTSMAQEMDSLQNQMIAALSALTPLPGEDLPGFFKHRCNMASSIASAQGRWAARWAKSILDFDAHCKRDHNGQMWHNHLAAMWTSEQLQAQRAKFATKLVISARTWTAFAGRTATRYKAGAVTIRREDSLVAASEFLKSENLRCTLKRLRKR
jgi:hypothetical protein